MGSTNRALAFAFRIARTDNPSRDPINLRQASPFQFSSYHFEFAADLAGR